MSVRRPRQRDARGDARRRCVRVARVSADHPTGAALRLPRARTVRSGQRAAVQPQQAAARPVCQGGRGRGRVGAAGVRLHLRRPRLAQRRGLRESDDEGRRREPVLRLGGRPAAEDPVCGVGDLRGARQGTHRAAPRHPRGDPRHLQRHRAPRDHRAPEEDRRDGHRAHAGAPVRQRLDAAGEGPLQLLGLQHDRLLRPAEHLRRSGSARPAGAGVQRHGAGAPRRRHRGDPRRGLQPHRRGQPPRPRCR